MKALRITERFTKVESESLKRYINEIANIPMFTPAEEAECATRAIKGDRDAIDELVQRNLRFVISIAKQYEMNNVSLPDLINEGNIGLVMAAEKFNPTTGFKFISYAVYWIRKMIMEYMAKNSRIIRLPSNKINSLSKLNQFIDKMEQQEGRFVDVGEVADEVHGDMTRDELFDIKNIAGFNFNSLDSSIDENNNTLYDIMADESADQTDHLVTSSDIKNTLKLALDTLKPTDRHIIMSLYGIDDTPQLSLKELGENLNMTRERVRQIRERALRALKIAYL